MKELSIPCIYQNQKMIGYGGNQDWFADQWAQKAGCGSVLGSNLYAYYHCQTKYELDDFIAVMEQMFEYMTPGYMGYPYLYKFARTFVRIMAKDGIALKPVYQKRSKNYKQALTFVLNSIHENHPVAMLILHHRAKELEEDNWHWICLTGYIEKKDGYDIIFSDCGQRRIIDAHILFDTYDKNVFKMVRMKIDSTK
jgi:hypothetical protein